MLAVLAEINCLNSLQSMGVYPDKFYTSFDAFKDEVVSFRNATIIVIFAGSYMFNKRVVINLAKSLMKRADNKSDMGIEHVYVFSDVTLSGLYAYYKYYGHLDSVDVMRGWKTVKEGVFPWTKLRSTKKVEAVCRYSHFDMGDAEAARKLYNEKYSSEDEYLKLIVVPELSSCC